VQRPAAQFHDPARLSQTGSAIEVDGTGMITPLCFPLSLRFRSVFFLPILSMGFLKPFKIAVSGHKMDRLGNWLPAGIILVRPQWPSYFY
jgi:hypothetical protein